MSADVIGFWPYFRDAFVKENKLDLPLKQMHEGSCRTMERAVLGELKKSFIVVNVPPRVGKTKMCEGLVTWQLAMFPDSQIIYTSYSNELATTSVRAILKTIETPWYQELFPGTKIGSIRQADHFNTTEGGKVYGDGIGGTLTGLGAGLKRRAGGFIVIDDPIKPESALSRVESERVRFWFENTIKSRRNSSQWTPIIVCAQRLAIDDLPGFLLENYPNDVELIKFPAMVDGVSQIPETISTKDLLDTERVNPFTFSAHYQQEPVVLGGNLIKLANFHYYDYGDPPKMEYKVITCDTAMKAKESADHSVLQCWGRNQHRAFLLDQIRGRWDPSELLRNAKVFYEKHHRAVSPVNFVAIEEAAAGYILLMEMRKRGVPARGISRLNDKVSRVKVILPYQVTGMVFLPKGAPWLPAFEVELAQFREDGGSKNDDQVDAFADGVFLILGKGTSILSVLGRKPKAA